MPLHTPFTSVRSPGCMVASADQLATQAGLSVFALGGNAVDAAIATNAAIGVIGPHMCGLGGDLFALVHVPGHGEPFVLNASGRAGSGVDPETLRRNGNRSMPFSHDPASVPVPGCVDGWAALHERFGTLPMATLLAPAIRLAEHGFPASPLLLGSLAELDDRGRAALHELAGQATRPGARVCRPGVARTLGAIADGGRESFYGGEFGRGLIELGDGIFDADDLARSQADWVAPLSVEAFGHRIWTVPPNSSGYLTLAGAWIASGLELPADPDDPLCAHLLIEAAIEAGFDRPDVLCESADGAALLHADRLAPRRDRISAERTFVRERAMRVAPGDTTYLCTVDAKRMGVSLIQSNASDFGSWLVEPSTGINLHNRGIGFSLDAGHPAELRPGARPPHTLAPALVTHADGSLKSVLGTMGGDAQPQFLLQILNRLLGHQQSPAVAIASPRWSLRGGDSGFDTWSSPNGPQVVVEGHAPAEWASALTARGHHVVSAPAFASTFGHAHCIVVDDNGFLAAAADPRTRIGTTAGL